MFKRIPRYDSTAIRACGALLLAVIVAGNLVAGCVTKARAKEDAKAAYIAGQQAAMRSMQTANQGPSVTVQGQVRNSIVPWTPDLTLARAIVMADYFGPTEPTQIYIIRGGIARQVDPRRLLSGEDVPIQMGDIIHLQPSPSTLPAQR